jgi:hypothetical protein
MSYPVTATAPKSAPLACPQCRGTDLIVAAASHQATTYARCVTCGEVWNAERRMTSSQPLFRSRPWGA